MRSADDEGYFPRGGSILRRIHAERAVGLFYGQRALMIGALKPLNFVGTIEHTRGRNAPFARLSHTAKAFETIFFGTRQEADRVLARVERMHQDVVGVLSEDAGATPAGSPYSAFDPDLMLWTVAVIADSARHFYELFVASLGDEDREALWQDYVRFGELFGMPREIAPPTHREFRDYWERTLGSDEMHLTPAARQTGYATAFEIPMPWFQEPAKRVHDLIMLGSLPERVRELYGLRWTPAQAVALRATIAALRSGRPLVPRRMREGPCAESYDAVAATERRRLERGKATPQVSG